MISRRNYFSILILLSVIFVMFMFVGVSTNIFSDTSTNKWVKDRVDIDYNDIISADSLNMDRVPSESDDPDGTENVIDQEQKLHVAILSGSEEDSITRTLVEWCVYSKYPYRIYTSWPDEGEIADYDVILFGNNELTSEKSEILYAYAELGKKMIFTQLPNYQEISANQELAVFFGIKAGISEEVDADGIKIFSNFMINTEREYIEGDYFGEEDDMGITLPYYSLAPGYEVYSVGLLDDQVELGIEDKDLPPLLWRTATKKSFVFVINSEIYQGMSLLGVLTGFMANAGECYLYPVVNAQTISLINYPYFSNENNATSQQLYSRSSESVARDLLWPNIVQILKNYGDSYNFFAAPQLDYLDEVAATNNYMEFYLREINKLPGVMGLSLGQVSGAGLEDLISKNELLFEEYLPDYEFTALYTAAFSTEQVEDNLDNELLNEVSLVMSDYVEGDHLISFLNNDTLSVKFNLDGFQHETMDDLQMICIENALGMCNVKVDIGRVIYPADSSDEWNRLSLTWSKGKTYFNDFDKLDTVSIHEMEKRIRRFLALDYSYEYIGDEVNIQIGNFAQEAYFILNIYSKSIDYVEHGSARQISDTTYLIKAEDANVRIHLTQENVLMKPDNNKTILGNPE